MVVILHFDMYYGLKSKFLKTGLASVFYLLEQSWLLMTWIALFLFFVLF